MWRLLKLWIFDWSSAFFLSTNARRWQVLALSHQSVCVPSLVPDYILVEVHVSVIRHPYLFMPCRTEDITNPKSTSKDLHASLGAALGAAGWRRLIRLRYSAAVLPPGPPSLQSLMRTFAAHNYPRVTAEQLGGRWAADARYFSRQPLVGCRSGQGLLLKDARWLEVRGDSQVHSPGNYHLL